MSHAEQKLNRILELHSPNSQGRCVHGCTDFEPGMGLTIAKWPCTTASIARGPRHEVGTDPWDRLRDAMYALEKTYEEAYARLERRIAEDRATTTPFDYQDTDGRPVLAPLLTALVNGYAALANMEGPR